MNKFNSYFGCIIAIGTLTLTIATVEPYRHGAQPRSGYGEHCNKTVRCRSQLWLSCDRETKTCQCTKADEMILDESTGKCVALIGERCKYGIESDDDYETLEILGPYEKADCVEGAVCDSSGFCSCPTGFYEDINMNKCFPVKGFGENCLSRQECNENKMLSCIDGQCSCDTDTALFNTQSFIANKSDYDYYNYPGGRTYTVPEGLCIGRAGSPCSVMLTDKYCISNSYCDNGTCKCEKEFTYTSAKMCGLGYKSTCSEVNVCSDKFRCTVDYFDESSQIFTPMISCNCPYLDFQWYDSISEVCKGLVGAPCSESGGYTGCTDNAVCREKNFIYQCECAPGYVETPESKCEIEYGQPCTWSEVAIPGTEMCDQVAKLRCNGGKCACKLHIEIYEESRRQCSIPIGLRCKETTQCVQDSLCNKKQNEQFEWGRCACKPGFEVAKNHTCVSVGSIEKSKDENSDSEQPVTIERTEQTEQKLQKIF